MLCIDSKPRRSCLGLWHSLSSSLSLSFLASGICRPGLGFWVKNIGFRLRYGFTFSGLEAVQGPHVPCSKWVGGGGGGSTINNHLLISCLSGRTIQYTGGKKLRATLF